MYSVLYTLSEYTYFYISKNITSYTFLLVFKIVKAFNVSLIQKFYFINLFLEKEVTHIYLNIRSLDMVVKVCRNEFSKSIFWAGVEEFLFK